MGAVFRLSPGSSSQILREISGGFEILFLKGRGETERFTGVVESVFVRRIDGEFASGADVNPGHAADWVVVFLRWTS